MTDLQFVPAFDDGNFKYHMRDDHIQVFNISDMRRAAVDRWFEITRHNHEVAAQRGIPVLSLYEIELAWPTPYMAARLKESTQTRVKTLDIRMAIVIADSFLSNIFTMFLQSLPNHILRDSRFFNNRDEALAWLHVEAAAFAETRRQADAIPLD